MTRRQGTLSSSLVLLRDDVTGSDVMVVERHWRREGEPERQRACVVRKAS